MTLREQEMSFMSEAAMLDNQEWQSSIATICTAMSLSHRNSSCRITALRKLNKAIALLQIDEQQCRKVFIDAQANITNISPQEYVHSLP